MKPTSELTILVAAVSGVLFLVVLVAQLFVGPRRWVKISTAALVASTAWTYGMIGDWRDAVQLLALILVGLMVSTTYASLLWRQPRTRELIPARPQDCPRHARDRVDQWGGELVAVGFDHVSDTVTHWRFGSSNRKTFIRFFAHPNDPTWVELHALERPKGAARSVCTKLGSGVYVSTCDQPADEELLPTSNHQVSRAPSGSTTEQMLHSHREYLAGTGQDPETIDPAEGYLENYHARIDELLRRRFVSEKGGEIAISRVRIPIVMLRILGGWFQ